MRHLATTFAILLAVGAVAHEGASGVVRDRMDAMAAMAQNMKTIKSALDTDRPDRRAVASAAKAIAARGGDALTALFPASTPLPVSEASPRIWHDFTAFEDLAHRQKRRAEKLHRGALDSEASIDQLAKLFADLVSTCRDCHREYRISK